MRVAASKGTSHSSPLERGRSGRFPSPVAASKGTSHSPPPERGRPGRFRKAAAAVEFAVLAPFLVFIFLVTVDFARLFFQYLTITNCARNGAIWASDSVARCQSPYATVQAAALADATNLNPTPTVTSTTAGSYVGVTVTYPFRTVATFAGVPKPLNLSRTVWMQMSPINAGGICP